MAAPTAPGFRLLLLLRPEAGLLTPLHWKNKIVA